MWQRVIQIDKKGTKYGTSYMVQAISQFICVEIRADVIKFAYTASYIVQAISQFICADIRAGVI